LVENQMLHETPRRKKSRDQIRETIKGWYGLKNEKNKMSFSKKGRKER